MAAAAAAAGAPDGTLGIVHGQQAGADLVAHPAIRAVGFTGSVNGGRALLEIIERRPDPIPFYGELSSLNPVVITPSAATERGDQIGRELVGSYTLGAGQFCTKPGLTFVPTGADGDRVVEAMADAIRGSSAQVLLNQGIASSYTRISDELATAPGVQEIARGADSTDAGFRAVPRLLATTGTELPAAVTEECFGPVSVVARYDAEDDLFAAFRALPSSLTATVLRGEQETQLPAGNLRSSCAVSPAVWCTTPTRQVWPFRGPSTTAGHGHRRIPSTLPWAPAPSGVSCDPLPGRALRRRCCPRNSPMTTAISRGGSTGRSSCRSSGPDPCTGRNFCCLCMGSLSRRTPSKWRLSIHGCRRGAAVP